MSSQPFLAALPDAALADLMTFTDEHRYGDLDTNTNLCPHDDIYAAIFANVSHSDQRVAVVEIPAEANIEHATCWGGYMVSRAPGTNGVISFSASIAGADDVKMWGTNHLFQDYPTREIGDLTGVWWCAGEYDCNIMCSDTEIVLLSGGGNSLVQPRAAHLVIANVLGYDSNGVSFKWHATVLSQDGAAFIGAHFGALEQFGTNVPSQPTQWSYFNGSGQKRTAKWQASTNRVTVSNDDDYLVFHVNGYINTPSGKGVAVGDQLVVAGRTSGFTAMTGTASKGACATYDAPTAAGSYSAAQMQAVMDALQALSRRMKAMDEVEFYNGRIGV